MAYFSTNSVLPVSITAGVPSHIPEFYEAQRQLSRICNPRRLLKLSRFDQRFINANFSVTTAKTPYDLWRGPRVTLSFRFTLVLFEGKNV